MAAAATKVGALDFERLFDFLDELRASSYKIDARQYMVLSDLLILLIARGETFDDFSKLKNIIAPLICSTPYEQEDFYQRFDHWSKSIQTEQSAANTPPLSDKPTTQPPAIGKFSIREVLIGSIIIAFVSIIVLIFQLAPAATGGGVAPATGSPFLMFGILLVGLLVVILRVWQLWKIYQGNQYITRDTASKEPNYTKLSVNTYIQEVLPLAQFKHIARELQRRIQVPSTEVDVEKTIENTLARSNWLEIFYRQRQLMPEYVVLIDRKSRLDHQARFVQEVLQRLAVDGIWLHQYEFSNDPRVCFPLGRKDTPLRLSDLQARHPGARLLVFSGTGELVNPLTGQLSGWLESLAIWAERAIFTPNQIHQVLQEELQARDFVILPISLGGLAALVRTLETDNAPILTNGQPSLPTMLTDRPLRWTSRAPLAEDELETLLDRLKNYLGENGFYWLCACAVYGELRWELTLHLGSMLKDSAKKPLLNADTLMSLVRLPWFRQGYMPDWFRDALVKSLESMGGTGETDVRSILQRLLDSANQSNKNTLDLFTGMKQSISKGDGALQEYIFQKFLHKKDQKRLAVLIKRVPKLSRSLFENLRKWLVEFFNRREEGESKPAPIALGSPLFADRYQFQTVGNDWNRGRSGFTHLVFDIKQERLGVIKRAEIKSQQAEELKNEAAALLDLKGLGVPEVYDTGKTTYGSKKYFYIVIEYIEGIRLEKNLDIFTVSERAEILTQFFSLLANAHRLGIVNGDVDLKHLFWRRDKKQLVVIDWGNARLNVNQNDKSEYSHDLARSAEIIYSLVILKRHPPTIGSLALPADYALIPGMVPLPIEFHNLCKRAPFTLERGQSPHTAAELFIATQRWQDRIYNKKIPLESKTDVRAKTKRENELRLAFNILIQALIARFQDLAGRILTERLCDRLSSWSAGQGWNISIKSNIVSNDQIFTSLGEAGRAYQGLIKRFQEEAGSVIGLRLAENLLLEVLGKMKTHQRELLMEHLYAEEELDDSAVVNRKETKE